MALVGKNSNGVDSNSVSQSSPVVHTRVSRGPLTAPQQSKKKIEVFFFFLEKWRFCCSPNIFVPLYFSKTNFLHGILPKCLCAVSKKKKSFFSQGKQGRGRHTVIRPLLSCLCVSSAKYEQGGVFLNTLFGLEYWGGGKCKKKILE